MIECHANGCPDRGTHYAENPSTRAPFYLCGKHMNDHALGFAFELDTHIRLAKDEPAAPLLTEGQLCGIVYPTSPTTKPEEAPVYSTISKAQSLLEDSKSEADEALEQIRSQISELEDAASELESLIDQLDGAISALGDLDGASVSVSTDGIEVYISL